MNQGRLQRFARGKTYNLSEIYAANEASKEPYLTALVELIGKLEDNHKAYYAGMGWQRDYEQKRGVTFGDKWDKVWVMTEYGNAEKEYKKARIVCHIDSNTGIIFPHLIHNQELIFTNQRVTNMQTHMADGYMLISKLTNQAPKLKKVRVHTLKKYSKKEKL